LLTAYLGELAALGAATVWTFSSLFFTIGGRRVGALVVNRTRLIFAVLLVGTAHWLLLGQPFPVGAEPFRFFWLTLSSLVGLVIGDTLLFQCYVLVGARIGVLLFVLSPVFGALLAWVALGERLGLTELAAIGVTLAGLIWVILERSGGPGELHLRKPGYLRGVLYGALSSLCQATNLVLSKQGLVGGFPALSAVMIRMTVGLLALWLLALLAGQFRSTLRALAVDRRALIAIFGGAFAGPFIGVWLSMVAVQSERVGIVATLMALTPVFSLPVVRVVFRERVTPQAIVGTLIAMVGVGWMILA
jgi:drug/metabolite transporter (DMT)-like permease